MEALQHVDLDGDLLPEDARRLAALLVEAATVADEETR